MIKKQSFLSKETLEVAIRKGIHSTPSAGLPMPVWTDFYAVSGIGLKIDNHRLFFYFDGDEVGKFPSGGRSRCNG
jgi:hypothetical protein